MKTKAKRKAKPRAGAQPSTVRVIRITEEMWAEKCGSLAKRQPVEPEEFFDRALRLGPRTKAS
jgi:hypothetical protein